MNSDDYESSLEKVQNEELGKLLEKKFPGKYCISVLQQQQEEDKNHLKLYLDLSWEKKTTKEQMQDEHPERKQKEQKPDELPSEMEQETQIAKKKKRKKKRKKELSYLQKLTKHFFKHTFGKDFFSLAKINRTFAQEGKQLQTLDSLSVILERRKNKREPDPIVDEMRNNLRKLFDIIRFLADASAKVSMLYLSGVKIDKVSAIICLEGFSIETIKPMVNVFVPMFRSFETQIKNALMENQDRTKFEQEFQSFNASIKALLSSHEQIMQIGSVSEEAREPDLNLQIKQESQILTPSRNLNTSFQTHKSNNKTLTSENDVKIEYSAAENRKNFSTDASQSNVLEDDRGEKSANLAQSYSAKSGGTQRRIRQEGAEFNGKFVRARSQPKNEPQFVRVSIPSRFQPTEFIRETTFRKPLDKSKLTQDTFGMGFFLRLKEESVKNSQ